VLLLDEPTSSLDIGHQQQVLDRGRITVRTDPSGGVLVTPVRARLS
jgi:ABC-type hemin transport system ATPase subunit